MTEPMVTMTGPARLRALADDANTQGFMWLSQDLRQLAALWEADLSYAAGLIADEILRAERAEAALDRATNDLMLSEESFVTMRAKRDDVLSELRELRAELERMTLGHAVALSKQTDYLLRAERAEAALSKITMALQEAEESIDRLQSTKEDLTAEIKEFYAEREAFYESFRRSYDEETKKLHAALEQARALAEKWRTLSEQSPTLFVYLGRAADELDAALLAAAPGGAA